MVKNISSQLDVSCPGNFKDLKKLCQEMENILNAEHGTIVKGPEILVTKDFHGQHDTRIHVIISYTPNTNNGYVKVKCSLTEHLNSDILTIESDYPVSLGIVGRFHQYIVAVWTETVSNEELETE